MSNAAARVLEEVSEALENADYEYVTDTKNPPFYRKPAKNGDGTDEFILNSDEGTVTREKYNRNGTMVLGETITVRHASDMNRILRHI